MNPFKVKVRESIIGPYYTFKTTGFDMDGKRFESVTTIVFAHNPMLVWGGSFTSIVDPSRFGSWDTASARRDYCRRFACNAEVTA